jgi:thioredoxin-related protein
MKETICENQKKCSYIKKLKKEIKEQRKTIEKLKKENLNLRVSWHFDN